jgi:hypothetical protein
MQDYYVIENVLSEKLLESLEKLYTRHDQKFLRIPTEVDACYLQKINPIYSKEILRRISEETNMNLKELVTVARLNDVDKDTKIRIHSDGEIVGRNPEWASVLYLESDDDGGTALFESETEGDRVKGSYRVFHEIGDFKVKLFNKAKRNTLFLYRACLLHGRQPFHYPKRRVVIVSFFN